MKKNSITTIIILNDINNVKYNTIKNSLIIHKLKLRFQLLIHIEEEFAKENVSFTFLKKS